MLRIWCWNLKVNAKGKGRQETLNKNFLAGGWSKTVTTASQDWHLTEVCKFLENWVHWTWTLFYYCPRFSCTRFVDMRWIITEWIYCIIFVAGFHVASFDWFFKHKNWWIPCIHINFINKNNPNSYNLVLNLCSCTHTRQTHLWL